MRASANALELIKRFEGCRLEAYPDSKGWAVGWGTTGPGITERTVISQGVANGMLVGDVSRLGQDITQLVGIIVNQDQFDALVALVYNIGLGAFKDSTMLKKIRNHDLKAAADEFLKWNHVDGKVNKGLTTRREAERELFLRKI